MLRALLPVLALIACNPASDSTVELAPASGQLRVEVDRGTVMLRHDPAITHMAVSWVSKKGVDGGAVLAQESEGVAEVVARCGVDPRCETVVDITLPTDSDADVVVGRGGVLTFQLEGGAHTYELGAGTAAVSFAAPPTSLDLAVGRGWAQVDVPAGAYALALDADQVDVDDAVTDGSGPALAVIVDRGELVVGAMPDTAR